TGTEKGHALFAGKTNGAQRTLGRGIRAARHAPDAVVGHQRGVILNTVGGQPVMLDCHTQGLAGKAQRLGNGPVRGDRRIEVPHQSNLESTLAVHALIPLLHGGLPATIRWRLCKNNWHIDKQRLHECNIESSTPTFPWCSPWCVVVPWRGPQTCYRWTYPPCSAPCAGWRLLWGWRCSRRAVAATNPSKPHAPWPNRPNAPSRRWMPRAWPWNWASRWSAVRCV